VRTVERVVGGRRIPDRWAKDSTDSSIGEELVQERGGDERRQERTAREQGGVKKRWVVVDENEGRADER
jgi:hypothetical protein